MWQSLVTIEKISRWRKNKVTTAAIQNGRLGEHSCQGGHNNAQRSLLYFVTWERGWLCPTLYYRLDFLGIGGQICVTQCVNGPN